MIPNLLKLFQILEIDIQRLRFVSNPTKFRTVIVPDSAFCHDAQTGTQMFSGEYVETLNRVRDFAFKHQQPISQKKFYFFYGRRLSIGEERIAQYVQSKGYTVIQPERYSLEDQLNIFANCENLVSTVGSCSHNTVFMKKDAQITLIPRYRSINLYQKVLNEIYGQNVFYVDSMFSIFLGQPEYNGPFCYILSENLRKHFGDTVTEKYTEEDFATFLAYVKYAESQGLNENPKELEYLKDILLEFMEQLKTHKDLMQKFGVFVE